MRVLLLSFCLLFSYSVLLAQTDRGLEGTYKRFKHLGKGGHNTQILELKGATSGSYRITEDGDGDHDFTSGGWREGKIWRRRYDSLHVLILDPENKYNARYFAIEPTGCLTPVYEDGYPMNRCNAFAPVRPGRARQ